MSKQILYCESCDEESKISYKKPNSEIEKFFCPLCGAEVDPDWNSMEEIEEC